jgi:hypothetical protein
MGPVKVDFLNPVFMLLYAILPEVSEKIAFNLMKIIQGTCLGPFFALKVFWVPYGPFEVFIRIFCSVQ